MTLRLCFVVGIVSGIVSLSPQGLAQDRTKLQDISDSELLSLLGAKNTDDARTRRFLEERDAIGWFLAKHGVKATDEAVDRRLEDVERVLRAQGKTLDEALAAQQLNRDTLRAALRVPIAWKIYLGSVVTEEAIARQFEEHRHQYDGTMVELAQIFLRKTDSNPSSIDRLTVKAATICEEIAAGKKSFADAVKEFSQSPSATNGGLMGAVRFRGDVPTVVAEWAFSADVGDMSDPVVSPVGVHVIKLLERSPGSKSLEDVRTAVIEDLSDQLWERALTESAREK